MSEKENTYPVNLLDTSFPMRGDLAKDSERHDREVPLAHGLRLRICSWLGLSWHAD